MDEPRTSDTEPEPESEAAPWLDNPVSDEGVDLTQIRALRAMTPTERAEALKRAANAMLELRRRARRI